jgi:hypothetical protein
MISPEPLHQPLCQRFTAEEKRAVDLLKYLQSTIWAEIGIRNAAGGGSGSYTSDSTDKAMERIGLVLSAEIDPNETAKESRETAFVRQHRPRKKDRRHAETSIPDPSVESCSHLLVLPGAETVGPQKDRTGRALFQGHLQRLLPRVPRHEMPFVEERPQTNFTEPMRKPLYQRLVGTIVA